MEYKSTGCYNALIIKYVFRTFRKVRTSAKSANGLFLAFRTLRTTRILGCFLRVVRKSTLDNQMVTCVFQASVLLHSSYCLFFTPPQKYDCTLCLFLRLEKSFLRVNSYAFAA